MSKRLRYLCIDDKVDLVENTLKRLERQSEELEITPMHPQVFEQQIAELQKERKDHELDGLLLDLRLDESAPTGEQRVSYGAQSLAQQLRTLMSEGRLSGFPIALWSIDSKFVRSYKPDITSHDLFDLVLDKDEVEEEAETTIVQLVSLARGYREIGDWLGTKPQSANSFENLLHLPDGAALDPRVGADFVKASARVPAHAYALFILRDLIRDPGPLIDRRILCARLGVDAEGPHTDKLLDKLRTVAAYSGPFADAWPRWCWSAVETWWRGLREGQKPLTSLRAEERVEILRKTLRLSSLRAAKPILSDYQTYFSTICQALKEPLDPINGFVIVSPRPQPWKDRLYVSAQAALNPGKSRFHGKLDPLEAERLKASRSPKRKSGEKR